MKIEYIKIHSKIYTTTIINVILLGLQFLLKSKDVILITIEKKDVMEIEVSLLV